MESGTSVFDTAVFDDIPGTRVFTAQRPRG